MDNLGFGGKGTGYHDSKIYVPEWFKSYTLGLDKEE